MIYMRMLYQMKCPKNEGNSVTFRHKIAILKIRNSWKKINFLPICVFRLSFLSHLILTEILRTKIEKKTVQETKTKITSFSKILVKRKINNTFYFKIDHILVLFKQICQLYVCQEMINFKIKSIINFYVSPVLY